MSLTLPEQDRHCRNCKYFLRTSEEKGVCQAEPQSIQKMEGETCSQFTMSDEYWLEFEAGIVNE